MYGNPGEFSGFALVPEQGAIPQKHQLDPDMQRRIEAMAARVDIRDNAAVMRSPMVAFSLSTTKTDSLNGAAAMQALW